MTKTLTSPSRSGPLATAALTALLGCGAAAFGQATTRPTATTEPMAAAPTTQPDPGVALMKQIHDDSVALNAVLTRKDLLDADSRRAAAPKVLPAISKLSGDFGELEKVKPQAAKAVAFQQSELSVEAAILGDAEAAQRLHAAAESPDPEVSLRAKVGQLTVDSYMAGKDADALQKVADRADVLAKANPGDPALTMKLYELSRSETLPPASQTELRTTLATMKNPAASMVHEMMDSDAKQAKLVGQPITISGQGVDGKPFTTADWKGKVILVDFWATWCGPCKAELPRVKQVYEQYHGQGLEVLGVSNDFSEEDLKKFLADDKAMAWQQLFDADAAKEHTWSAITRGYGIMSIPQMYLIDKAGVLRSVTAREDFEEMIPKLLAQK